MTLNPDPETADDVNSALIKFPYFKGASGDAVAKAKKKFAEDNDLRYSRVIGKKIRRNRHVLYVFVAEVSDLYQ